MRASYQISCSYFFGCLNPGVGGDSYIKPTGKLVVSLWGVNCRFWSHLGFLGWKVTILVCLFRYRLVLRIKKLTKIALTLTTQKSSLRVSLSLSHTHIGLPWRFNLNFCRASPSLLHGSPPRGLDSFCVFQASTKQIWWAWGTLDGATGYSSSVESYWHSCSI